MRAFRWIVCCSTVCALACGASRVVLSGEEQTVARRSAYVVDLTTLSTPTAAFAQLVTFGTQPDEPEVERAAPEAERTAPEERKASRRHPGASVASGVLATGAMVGDANFWGELGVLQFEAREQKLAVGCFLQAHRLAPDGAWLDLLDGVDASIVVKPLAALCGERRDDPLVQVKLAETYTRLGQARAAHMIYLGLVVSDFSHATLYHLDELPAGDLIKTLNYIYKREPTAAVCRMLAEAHLRAGATGSAINWGERTFALGGGDAAFAAKLVQRDAKVAVRVIQRRIAAGADASLWVVLAEAHLALSQPDRAANALELAFAATGEARWLQALNGLDPDRAIRRLTPARTALCECTSPGSAAPPQ